MTLEKAELAIQHKHIGKMKKTIVFDHYSYLKYYLFLIILTLVRNEKNSYFIHSLFLISFHFHLQSPTAPTAVAS